MMIRALIAVLALLAAVSGDGLAQTPEPIHRIPLEQPESLGTVIAMDPEMVSGGGDGSASVRIRTGWPTTINLDTVADIDIEAATLLYQAQVRCPELAGIAFLEMWARMPDGRAYFSRGLDGPCRNSADWKTLATRFVLGDGQNPSAVILNITIDGIGTVWVDDLRLSIVQAP